MNKTHWKKISRILDHALNFTADRRATYMKKICADDPELQTTIQKLLKSIEASDLMLEDYLKKNGMLLNDLHDTLEPCRFLKLTEETVIGDWHVIEMLGQGGMGAVYKAKRTTEGVRQTAAVKVLHQGLNIPENVRRFRLEQQILAGLHHPNIASLIDSGISQNGLPFLVMEYVDGIPIDQYCDQHRLNLNERLSLFKTTCQAVQHAHNNLIVHRDLKPENILVSEERYVKILDFGIAKLLDADLYELPAVETRKCVRLMSLEYAAPEQISGDPITTSADVYSLGVLLYELLAGVHPFDFEDKRFGAIEQIVLHEDPPAPTRNLFRLPENKRADITNKRQSSFNKLISQLTGDLDAIILKTLRKEPEKRYETVSQLVDDADLYLQNKPVGARIDTSQYRILKFFKRHAKGIATAALFTTFIIALIAFYTFRLTEERNVAQMEVNKTEQVKNLFVEIFQSGNPFQESDAKNLTVQQVLDQGTKRISEELESQPLIKAELQEALGSVYSGLMMYPKAESLLREALSTYETEQGPHHPGVARISNLLGYILFRKGSYDEATTLFEDAKRISENKYGEDHPQYADAIKMLANLYSETGEAARGIQLLKQATRIYEDNNSPEIAGALSDLGYLLMGVGRLDEAIDNFQRFIDLYDEGYIESDASFADVLTGLAQTKHFKGDLKTAETIYRRVLRIRQRLFDPGHTYIAGTHLRLGWVLIDEGRISEAIPMVQKAYKSFKNHLPADHWKITACEGVLALGWIGHGKFMKAEKTLLNTLKVFKNQFGLNDWRTRSAQQALAKLYSSWNKPQKAAKYLTNQL